MDVRTGPCSTWGVAYMLTTVISAAATLRDARRATDLSQRALAESAGVAWSTIARIERGHVDPTVGMLNRLLAAAGSEATLKLARRRTSPTTMLASLVDAWTTGPDGTTMPDWSRLRDFIDDLALHPDRTYAATLYVPAPSGSAVMDAILASLAEKACDDVDSPRPTWTRRVLPVPGGWALPGTPAMIEKARAATPPQFARRGLALAERGLWRDRSTVGI